MGYFTSLNFEEAKSKLRKKFKGEIKTKSKNGKCDYTIERAWNLVVKGKITNQGSNVTQVSVQHGYSHLMELFLVVFGGSLLIFPYYIAYASIVDTFIEMGLVIWRPQLLPAIICSLPAGIFASITELYLKKTSGPLKFEIISNLNLSELDSK